MSDRPPRLRITGLSKSFGATQALRGVDLEVGPGEVHGLIGENGAGKSTLIRCATGVIRPDAGRIEVDGHPVQASSPRATAALGIAAVHQEAACFGELSVAENMLLPDRLVRWTRWGPVHWRASHALARSELATLGLDFDVRQPAGRLSVAERMLMQTAANVAIDVGVLFLDEPSASLTDREANLLFDQVRRLSRHGVSVIFVSHRLAEVTRLCDRVTVLRDGESVWTQRVGDVSMDDMIAGMVGREIALTQRRRARPVGDAALEAIGLSDVGGRIHDVDLSIRSGEVVAMYGVVGAGRSELAQALFGLRPLRAGRVRVAGKPYHPTRPADALRAGLAYVPEDRLVQGLFAGLSVWINATVSMMARWSRRWLRQRSVERQHLDRTIADMRVQLADARQPIQTLSGGNQQKILLGRALTTGARALIFDEPTRGVDVHAKAEIHQLIGRLADQDRGVLVISSDLPEVLTLGDRIAVMCDGRVTGVLDGEGATEEAVVALSLPPEVHRGTGLESATRRSVAGPLRDVGLVGALLLIATAMAVLRPQAFATWQNAVDVASSVAILTVLAVGATLVIGAGGIDISVGSVMGLVGAVAGLAAQSGGWPAWAAVALAISLGAGIGLVNAIVCVVGRIHPIVVTLAGMAVYRGAMLAVTGGYEVGDLPPGYLAVGYGWLGPLPKVVWFAIGVVAVGWLFLSHFPVGRRLLAVGGAARAGEQLGISRNRMLALAFAANGALVGLAGVLHATYYTRVQSNTGEGIELQAIAAAVIGGCAITGGTGSALGAALGAGLIGLVYNALILLQVSSYWHPFFVGLLILGAATLDGAIRRR